jgi:predicted ATP-grasp superfamily ATP-dependent carboligase
LSTVLVTDGELAGSLAAIRALASAGHETWVSVTEGSGPTYGSCSRYAAGVVPTPDPSVNPAAYATYLRAEARRVRADVVIPGAEPALLALADLPARPAPPLVAVPQRAVLTRALDKELLQPAAAAAGLDVPATNIVKATEVRAGDSAITFPAVVKPTRSELIAADGRLRRFAVTVADTNAELADRIARLPSARALVQPYVSGDLYAISGVMWKGRLRCSVHQLAQRLWPPRSGIIAHAVTVDPIASLDEAVTRFLRGFDWNGIFQLQFIRRGDRFLLIDFNPRLYASLALAVAAGANLPAIWMALLLDNPLPPVVYRPGVSYRSEEHDLRALAAELHHRNYARVARALVPRRARVNAVFALRDPLPTRASLHKLRHKVRGRPT